MDGGLDRIEQSHESDNIYHKALWIIDTFFLDGNQYDEEIAPRFTKVADMELCPSTGA